MAHAILDKEYVVIGAGMAGLCCTSFLKNAGADVLLCDVPVHMDSVSVGGFAEFSGAKFSLPPAGLGLVDVVGGMDELQELVDTTLAILADSCIEPLLESPRRSGRQRPLKDDGSLREYHSIVLTPSEMNGLIAYLGSAAADSLIKGRIVGLKADAAKVEVEFADRTIVRASKVVCAVGRTGAVLLRDAGARPQIGKGIDVGVRVEFPTTSPLESLRAQGPDAKLMRNDVRSFCLNVPGKVYHYEALGFHIPGGVVAESGYEGSNVGILRRFADKGSILARFITLADRRGGRVGPCSFERTGPSIVGNSKIKSVLGQKTCDDIEEFTQWTSETGLIDWSCPHLVHYPLLDWHWDVFGCPGTFATTLPNVYAAGDLSGHARGLLQAAVSGVAIAKGFVG